MNCWETTELGPLNLITKEQQDKHHYIVMYVHTEPRDHRTTNVVGGKFVCQPRQVCHWRLVTVTWLFTDILCVAMHSITRLISNYRWISSKH